MIDFCKLYSIQLEHNYEHEKVKKTTPIYFYCGQCGIKVKKSFKLLIRYIDHPNVATWSGFCNKCFKMIHH